MHAYHDLMRHVLEHGALAGQHRFRGRRAADGAGLGDALDRVALDVHELDVRAIVGLEVVGIDAQALHAERIALR